ncbi:MAG: Gldg family protein [Bacteroidia bacterium]|nr:Gldg family protein [Bacteroidia bacterium]
MKLTKSTVTIRLFLYAAAFVVLNLLAAKVFFRLDFTADRRYTLSQSTKDIVKAVEEPVTITAYFSRNLPPELSKTATDLKDILAEYKSYSPNIEYEFIDPGDNEETQQEATQAGIFPLDISARERDQIKVVRGFMGVLIKMGNRQEVIPLIQSASGMEYSLSSGIKKLSVTEKPKVGFLQGHGEPGPEQLQQVMAELSNLYEIDTFTLSSNPEAWSAFKTVVILGPSRMIPQEDLAALDQFLASGGRLMIGINAVGGDLQAQQPWDRVNTGLDTWLSQKGIVVEQTFLTDVKSATINLQRRQGFFVVTQPVPFPYFPTISNFNDHPITQGLEEVLIQFGSPITIVNQDTALKITPLAMTTEQSGKIAPPTFFDPEKQWTTDDFVYGVQNIAVTAEGKFEGEVSSKMVVVGDGDFPLNPPQQQISPNNINLLVNAIDWLTDDTGLIALRTSGVDSRPLEKLIQDDDETVVMRNLVKYSNFFIPILIVIVFGVVRFQRQRNRRLKWMAEDYS